jgi:hypothetical protein
MLEMSATCHDRKVPIIMIEECHASQLMDSTRLRLLDISTLRHFGDLHFLLVGISQSDNLLESLIHDYF